MRIATEEAEDTIDLFLHQQGLDTTTPAGKALFQMMGVFAEFERSMIQELSAEIEGQILAALKIPGRTEGVRKIAKRFGVDPSTVH